MKDLGAPLKAQSKNIQGSITADPMFDMSSTRNGTLFRMLEENIEPIIVDANTIMPSILTFLLSISQMLSSIYLSPF